MARRKKSKQGTNYVSLFRGQDRSESSALKWLDAVDEAVTHPASCVKALNAAKDLRIGEAEDYFGDLLDACTMHNGFGCVLGDGRKGTLIANVLFMPLVGNLQDIRDMMDDQKSRDRIARSFCRHGAISGEDSVYVPRLLMEPNALIELSCTDLVALREACDILRQDIFGALSGGSDANVSQTFADLHEMALKSVAGRDDMAAVLGARLAPVVHIAFVAEGEDADWSWELMFPEDRFPEWQAEVVGERNCVVSYACDLVEAAKVAVIDLCVMARNIHRHFDPSTVDGQVTASDEDDLMITLSAPDGSELSRFHKMLPILAGREFVDELHDALDGCLSSAEASVVPHRRGH